MKSTAIEKCRMTNWCLVAAIMVICAVALGTVLFYTPGQGSPARSTAPVPVAPH